MTSIRLARRGLLAATALAAALATSLPIGVRAQDLDKIIVLINPNSNADTTESMTEIAATETEGVARWRARATKGSRRC